MLLAMIAGWVGGFIAGILLGKHVGFPYLQNGGDLFSTGIILIPVVMVLTAFRRKELLFCLGCFWGVLHAAPDFVGSCREFVPVRANLLQRSKGPAIVAIDGKRFEVVLKSGAATSGGYVGGSGLLSPRVISSACSNSLQKTENMHPRAAFLLDRFVKAGGSPELTAWTEASVFGSRRGLRFYTQEIFREAGLIHLLVVSGLHVGLFALFCRVFLLLPLMPIYALTLMTASFWKKVLLVSELVSLPLVCSYVWLIDAPSPAQRAAAFYVLWVLCKLFFGVRRPASRFAICLVAQTVLFPVGFLAAGNMMSWMATLLLVARIKSTGGYWSELATVLDFRLQLKIMLVAACLFAELTPLGLPANLLLAPVFGVILQLTYLSLLFPHPLFCTVNANIVQVYLGLVERIASFPVDSGLFWLSRQTVDASVRCVLIVLTSCLLLNSLRDMSIRIPDD